MGGTYHDLKVWQSAMDLTPKVYRVTQKFPAHEPMAYRHNFVVPRY